MTENIWADPDVAAEFAARGHAARPRLDEQLSMMLRLIEHLSPNPRLVLDIGCGDGLLGLTVAQANQGARIVLLDSSAAMLGHAEAAAKAFGGRVQLIEADLGQALGADLGAPDVVVAGYVIHHLPDERKRALYHEVFDILAPAGLFVNLERVAPATPAMAQIADEALIDGMAAARGVPRGEAAAQYRERMHAAHNMFVQLEPQLAWLRTAGFENVECYYRFLTMTVFAGTKPRAQASGPGDDHPAV